MGTLAVPGASAVDRRPLSNHGMPRPPRVTSPDRPHRFSGGGSPSHQTISAFASPISPGPMSPPMSARSFGTFIDSEPSTPAYSPRMDYGWDDSTLVLLRPMSSSSEPASPTEPAWEMLTPVKRPQQFVKPLRPSVKGSAVITKEVPLSTQLAPVPTKKAKSSQKTGPLKETRVVDFTQKENNPPLAQEMDEPVSMVDQTTDTNAAPLGKFASKMKFMLRRRSTNGKKKEKKKDKQKDYYDPMEEQKHWTEM